MSTRLVILALLKSKPLHGYELKRTIEVHMGDWTNIAFGSIYFALDKLNEEGFVERISEEKVGNRPSRSVYKITEKGTMEIANLLREIWQRYDREYYPLDIALAFSNILPPDEVKSYIRKRMEKLDEAISYLEKHKEEQMIQPDIPKLAKLIFTHTGFHLKAERDWLSSVSDSFNAGEGK